MLWNSLQLQTCSSLYLYENQACGRNVEGTSFLRAIFGKPNEDAGIYFRAEAVRTKGKQEPVLKSFYRPRAFGESWHIKRLKIVCFSRVI